MPERYLSTVTYVNSRRGSNSTGKLLLTECIDGEKKLHVDKKPTLSFFVDMDDIERDRGATFVPIDEVVPIEKVPYGDVGRTMAELAGLETEWERSIRDRTSWNMKEYMRKLPFFHGTDIHVEDHYIGRWIDRYQGEINIAPNLHKAHWDIEVDSWDGNPFDRENAPCPIDAISLYSGKLNTLYVFLLRNEDNPLVEEFEKNLEANADEAIDRFDLDECRITFFEDERKLILSFFRTVNEELRPDFLGAWNQGYDFCYMEGRIKKLFRCEPSEIMCPKDFPFKKAYYYEDTRNQDWSTKGDYAVVAGWTNYIDQLITYANLRATLGKKDGYGLDDIAEEEKVGSGKDPMDCSMREFSRTDYKKYVFYNMNDSILLHKIEQKTKDIDLIYQIAMITRTRVHKAWRKTVSLRNLALKHMFDQGLIMSNNRNVGRKHGGKFRGAWVMSPENNASLGVRVMGHLLNSIFENVCDLDLSSLYPSIILSCMIDPSNQIGRLMFKSDNDPGDELGYKLTADLLRGDMLKLGHRWLGLPAKDELLKILET